jgi:hypothetical protein
VPPRSSESLSEERAEAPATAEAPQGAQIVDVAAALKAESVEAASAPAEPASAPGENAASRKRRGGKNG